MIHNVILFSICVFLFFSHPDIEIYPCGLVNDFQNAWYSWVSAINIGWVIEEMWP